MIGELTATVEVRKRGFFGTLVQVPKVFRQHYRVMRRHDNGRLVSIYGAWLLARLIVTVR
jgi:hypothetical protein